MENNQSYTMKNVILLVLSILSFNIVTAQIVTDRPTQSASSSTVPKGALQLESRFMVTQDQQGGHTYRQTLLPTNLFRYGFTNWMEIRVVNQYEIQKYKDKKLEGFSDMTLGIKVQLLKKENINTEIAFLSQLIVPSGSNYLTADQIGTSNLISLSHSLSETIGINYNLGYNYFGEGNGNFIYSFTFGFGVNSKVGFFVEPYGQLANMDDFEINIDSGFTYLLKDNLQLDLAFGSGINHRMNFFTFGVSWLFERK